MSQEKITSVKNKTIRKGNKFLVFSASTIGQAEISEVVASMEKGWLGTGPKVARFEEDFKNYKGCTVRCSG